MVEEHGREKLLMFWHPGRRDHGRVRKKGAKEQICPSRPFPRCIQTQPVTSFTDHLGSLKRSSEQSRLTITDLEGRCALDRSRYRNPDEREAGAKAESKKQGNRNI